MKITSFNDIPRFTKSGSYHVDIPLNFLERYIKEMQEDMNLQLTPVFQRGHVWTKEQQIAYIEFFLRGGKTSRTVYFNCPSWQRVKSNTQYNDFVCVDGLQRLTALLGFLHNEIPAFGSYYEEFTDKPNILDHSLSVNINDLQTEEEVLTWYIEMNTGGTPHTKEEIDRVKKILEEKREKK